MMKLPLPRHDRLAHFWYGAQICVAATLAARLAMRVSSELVELLQGVNQMLAALAFGMLVCAIFALLKEWLDDRANKKAIAAGLPPPHGVEKADAAWTIYGGACVAVPSMFLLYI